MAEVDVPSAVIDVGAAVIKEVDAEAAPAVNITVAISVIAAPLTVPVTVAVPTVADEVSVAV